MRRLNLDAIVWLKFEEEEDDVDEVRKLCPLVMVVFWKWKSLQQFTVHFNFHGSLLLKLRKIMIVCEIQLNNRSH